MGNGGSLPAGSGRAMRLDPFTLPVRFVAHDARADQRTRIVELTREQVSVQRAVSGIRMAVNVPVSTYLGVTIRTHAPDATHNGYIEVVLVHRDPGLCLTLFEAEDGNDVVAEWQTWARVLGLPLLVTDGEGGWREPFGRVGALLTESPRARRRRRGALKGRRPSILMRRKPGRAIHGASVHSGEYEIIARN